MILVNPLQRRLLKSLLVEDFKWLRAILSSQSVKGIGTMSIDFAEKEAIDFLEGRIGSVSPITRSLAVLMFNSDIRFWYSYLTFFVRRNIGVGSWGSLPVLMQIMRLQEEFIDEISGGI